jgi:hypothetical protein
MNEEKFIDLINKEIDGIISTQEKKSLLHYLEENPEAKQKYFNLTRSIKHLDKLHDVEPPEELKSRIMNSIDFNRYTAKQKKKPKIKFPLLDFLITPKPKLAYAFAFGTVFGFLVYSIFVANLIQSDRIEPSDITGTMAVNNLSSIKNIATIPVSLDKIAGEIVVNRYNSLIWFDIKLESSIKTEFVLEFAKNTFNLQNYNKNPDIHSGEDFVKIPLNMDKKSPIYLLKRNGSVTAIDLKLFHSDKLLFIKKIEINCK